MMGEFQMDPPREKCNGMSLNEATKAKVGAEPEVSKWAIDVNLRPRRIEPTAAAGRGPRLGPRPAARPVGA